MAVTWRHNFGTPIREGPCILTLGNFDGVHLGHRAMIGKAKLSAELLRVPLAAVTFDPHPTAVLDPKAQSKLLMTLPQRLKALASAGVDLVWVVPFNYDVARLSPLAFLFELHQALAPIELHVGYGFRFGTERCGSLVSLDSWSLETGCKVYSHNLETYGGDIVSSTRIRKALGIGEVELARILLGSPYSLTGATVLDVDLICTNSSFVFSIAQEQELLLCEGVYITEVNAFTNDSHILGITRVSPKASSPTADKTGIVVETNLLDVCSNVCGSSVELSFLHRLRDTCKFISNDEALMQTLRDETYAKIWYSNYRKRH